MNSLCNTTQRNANDFSEQNAQFVLVQGDDCDFRRNFLNQSAAYLGMDLTDRGIASIIAGDREPSSTNEQASHQRIM